jgi:hypothetical protein
VSKKPIIFGVSGFAMFLQVAFHACSPKPTPVPGIFHPGEHRFKGEDAMEKLGKQLAGASGFDCGRVPVNGDPKAATQCVLRLQKQGRPFRVRYDLQGIDSDVAEGLVRTPLGKIYALDFDGDPSGGGGTNVYGGLAKSFVCPAPVLLELNPKGHVNCVK